MDVFSLSAHHPFQQIAALPSRFQLNPTSRAVSPSPLSRCPSPARIASIALGLNPAVRDANDVGFSTVICGMLKRDSFARFLVET